MISLALSALLAFGPVCDPVDGPKIPWSKEERAQTYKTAMRACGDMGAAFYVCGALYEVIERETHGAASRWHTSGHKEHGLGPFALGEVWRWTWWRWAGVSDVDVYCDPYATTIMVLAMYRYWYRRGAEDLRGLQRGFSGHSPAKPRERGDRQWCSRLKKSGIPCTTKIKDSDFGIAAPYVVRFLYSGRR